MIEVVAIDNRGAEAELLRLAADFAQSRLFTPKQQKRLAFVVEVTGTGAPAPIAREQLAKTPGLFKASQYHFTATISLLYGFESAALQLMHEVVHISQIINNRYQIAAKKVKQDGIKQLSYQAKWLGKKAGFIDQIEWQERPWEQEAAIVGERLANEFMGFLYGTQNSFEPQGHEKGAGKMLRLYELAIALPIDPPAPSVMPAPVAPQAPIFDPIEGAHLPEEHLPEEHLPDAVIPDFGAASFGAPDAENDAQSDVVLADIDALLAADSWASAQDAPQGDSLGHSIDEGAPEAPASLPSGEKQTYVLGIAEPRLLKLSVLEAKRQELAKRGLLEG